MDQKRRRHFAPVPNKRATGQVTQGQDIPPEETAGSPSDFAFIVLPSSTMRRLGKAGRIYGLTAAKLASNAISYYLEALETGAIERDEESDDAVA